MSYETLEKYRQEGYLVNGQALTVARGIRPEGGENADAAAHAEGTDYAEAVAAENKAAIKNGKAEKVNYRETAQQRARRKGVRVGHGSLNG